MIRLKQFSCLLAIILQLPFTTAQNTTSLWPTHSYKSSNATPPVLSITRSQNASCALAPGYIFFAPDGTPALNPNSAPYIMDPNSGELIWAGPSQHAFAFGTYTYRGEKVLAGWNGTVFREPVGRGNGVIYLWNSSYDVIATVELPGNFAELTPGARFLSNIDLHEIYITEEGTMLVTANNVTTTDLTSVSGPSEGWVTEAQFYEIDISTNEVLWSWKSLDHLDVLPLTASVYPLGSEGYDGSNQTLAWGYFHPNSIAPYPHPGGAFIVSSRYLCSAIVIARETGEVLWRLQGRDGNGFHLGQGADFCYQHHIRVVDHHSHHQHGNISHVTLQLHDNHNCPIDNGKVPTSGKVLAINLHSKHVSLLQQYRNTSGPIYANAQGSFQRLSSNQNVFSGHGWVPVFEEFSPSGHPLSTIQFGHTPLLPGGGFNSSDPTAVTLSYRAFKDEWIGCPTTKPSVHAEYVNGQGSGVRVWVSWNGATEVEKWAVYGGIETVSLITTVEKKGFETVVDVPDVEFVRVKAITKDGGCGDGVESELVFLRDS